MLLNWMWIELDADSSGTQYQVRRGAGAPAKEPLQPVIRP